MSETAHKSSARVSILGSRLTSIVSVTLVLLILGVIGIVFIASQSATRELRSHTPLTVELENDTSDSVASALTRFFGRTPYAATVQYLSAQEILEQEMSVDPGRIDPELLDTNPFSAEITVTLKPEYSHPDSIAAIRSSLAGNQYISYISVEAPVVEQSISFADRLTLILICVAGAMLLISFVLINNTIYLSVYSRRFIIHTMKLVGATGSFIRAPFVRAGFVCGLVSGIMAAGILAASTPWISSQMVTITGENPLPWDKLGILLGALVILGLLLSTVAATMATNRYLRSSYDKMFKK